MKIRLGSVIFIIALAIAAAVFAQVRKEPAAPSATTSADVKITFPSDKYPETAAHIKHAITHGKSNACTIDRKDADAHRKLSLHDVPTKKGYDRDEWPMAMCAEGGTGADIEYITPADNRGAGSWVKNELERYPDGTRVEFVVP